MPSRYDHALQIAIRAAREAGALLRAEFLRPGGARGHGGHAEADKQAELLIRAHLMTATPEWSFVGEETGRFFGPEGHHLWLVDPNDGTSAYLQGYRGSAVSIGLLRDGNPVLGVVYAVASPDNAGQLFAWAEGREAIERDGEALSRPDAPGLVRGSIAIVSHKADTAIEANMTCVAPARYRGEPSIAYRLALVAAGEGVACSGLSRPVSWDYGGGHALVLAVGGELLNERGEAIRYDTHGVSAANHVFGGDSAAARTLSERSWGEVSRQNRDEDSALFDLCSPRRNRTIADNAVLRRVQGCWLGQLTGDALGSAVEFRSADQLRRQYPDGLREIVPSPVWHTIAGQPTDDSELALMLARTLVRDGGYAPEAVAGAYAYYLISGPFDIGGTIGASTRAMAHATRSGESLVEAAHRHANPHSEANGALMRHSPLAIWGHAMEPERLDKIVRADTTLTHPNLVCRDASSAFVAAVAAAIRGGLDARATHQVALQWNAAHGSSPSVTAALERATSAPPDFSQHAGHVIVALQNAFYQLLHAESLEAGVVATVMGGGDTDTNAAIAGALLGAVHGAPAIPKQWRDAVITCRPLAGTPGIRQPRPRPFWPCDALILAEMLATAG
jgi:ADP-ribosyl-[dinitrogen reductase] hydrolase